MWSLYHLVSVYSVGSCKPDEFAYAWFWDKERNTYLADVFSTYWLHHTETVCVSIAVISTSIPL